MNKELHPLVSIVIPVYNGSNYMREAIDSALAQTYTNIEILVINDGSTDDGTTHDIAMSYGNKIRYFQKENGGVVSALNFGIKNMKGEYFSWLSHDDIYMPEKIEKQIMALKNHGGPRPAFCISNCTFINEKGEKMYNTKLRKEDSFDNPRCFLFFGNMGFNGIMVLIPKVLFDICGNFKPSLATHEYDMWIRIMEIADVVVEPECLSCMRLHSDQITNQNKLSVNQEIDNFSSNAIREIPYLDFRNFILDQINKEGIDYFFDLLNSYMWFQHYPLTSVQILKKFRLMLNENISQIDDFYITLLGHIDIEEKKAYLIQRNKANTPLIIIYCENITDKELEGMSTGIALLSTQYEIVLFYKTMEEYHLNLIRDLDILPIKLVSHLNKYIPLHLSLLSYLLNAKLFWYYTIDNTIKYSEVFTYLDIMQIYSLVSINNLDKIFFSDSNMNMKKNISKVSLITCYIAPSVKQLSVIENSIVILGDNLEELVRWKMIFNILLSLKEFSKAKAMINNNLSTIIEKCNVSFADYINNYIKEFILEVDIKAATLINSYENRRFWKLTKPFRNIINFLCKVKKGIKRVLKQKKSFRSIIYNICIKFRNRIKK